MVANTELPTEEEMEQGGMMNEFAALLEEYDYSSPYRGQILDGVIIRSDDHEIMLDVGLKRDAFVPRTDIDRLDDDVLVETHTRHVRSGICDATQQRRR